ncbi:DUF3152 domain-containing protein [Cellulosimicrobium arenosum]|uniref:DUF3152 domain-containing protein n=1 Tax=Cellulosimicrobium arenosum TaxID=2708133 RepID=UPI0030CA52A5
MPDPVTSSPSDRTRTARRGGPWHVAALVTCLVVGSTSGVATAMVWDAPEPEPSVSTVAGEAAATHDVPAPPTQAAPEPQAGAASRSAAQRPVHVDPDAPTGLVVPTDDPEPVEPVPAPRAPVTPTPAPDPTPSPVEPAAPTPEPGSGLLGTDVVEDLGGELVVVGAAADAPGDAATRSVRVEVEDGLPVDGDVFADAVLATLNDPRGWSSGDGVTFSRTAGADPSIRVVLASPATVDRLCAPLETEGTYSCGNAVDGVAVLNFERWVVGAPDFGDDVATYRQYLVNHEVGHVLGHSHESCPGEGEVAPVMVQQSISTEGCLPNGWPSP